MANLSESAQKRKRGRPVGSLNRKGRMPTGRKPTARQRLEEKLRVTSNGTTRLLKVGVRVRLDNYVRVDGMQRIFIEFKDGGAKGKCIQVASGEMCRKEDFDARNWAIRSNRKATENLQLFRGEIVKIKEHLKRLGEPINAEKLRELFLSERGLVVAPTVAKALQDELQWYVKRFEAGHIGKACMVANQKYLARHTEWLQAKHPNLRFDQLRGSHADSFFDYFALERGMAISYTRKMWHVFKSAINRGIRAGWVSRDPFIGYRTPREKVKPIEYLTADELTAVERLRFTNDTLDLVRDGFLAACYSGLAYIDLRSLSEQHLVTLDGVPSLVISRAKMISRTGAVSAVPILPPLQVLIDKYADSSHRKATGLLLPMLTNQKMNQLLKSIAEIAGLKKRLVTHMGRKTYATMVANLNVSEGSLAKSLGHDSTQMTRRHYAEQLETSTVKEIMAKWDERHGPTDGKQVQFISKTA